MGRGAALSVEFPVPSADRRKLIIPHGEGCSSGARVLDRSNMVREENFISPGMFQIAKRDDLEWKKKQAEEIKAMLFKSPQPRCVKEALEHIHSEVEIDPIEQDKVMESLNSTLCMLEAALMRMEKLGKREWGEKVILRLMGYMGSNMFPLRMKLFSTIPGEARKPNSYGSERIRLWIRWGIWGTLQRWTR
jgi:hypothetical protein